VNRIVNDEVIENLDKIKIYPIRIKSGEDLAKEIARVANLSVVLRYRLEEEIRVLTKDEAYQQLGHSASVFRTVIEYSKKRQKSSHEPP
jgi:predicted house-cleaning noncanonical NTP pyrophosphatase (MazG superfamily)